MRSKRIHKFRKKNRSLMIILKLSFIFYLFLFMAGYVMSSTTAYFSSDSDVNQAIKAAAWSDLDFVSTDSSSDEACSVTATLTNNGEAAMQASSAYTVYYAEDGVPKTDGKPKHHGTIERLEPGEETQLTYNGSKPGVYQFVAEQNDDHPNEQSVWSDKISAVCDIESDNAGEGDDTKGENADEEKQDEDEGKETKEESSQEINDQSPAKDEKEKREAQAESENTSDEEIDTKSPDNEAEEAKETVDNQEQINQPDGEKTNSSEQSADEASQVESDGASNNDEPNESKSKYSEDDNSDKETNDTESSEDPEDTEEESSSEKAQGDEVDQ